MASPDSRRFRGGERDVAAPTQTRIPRKRPSPPEAQVPVSRRPSSDGDAVPGGGGGAARRNFGPDAPPKGKRKPQRKDEGRPRGPIKERPVSRLYENDEDWRAAPGEEEVEIDDIAIRHRLGRQRLDGSAFRADVPARADAFRVRTGSPRRYVKTGDNGARRHYASCGTCGSPVHSCAVENPPTCTLRVGALNQRQELGRPERQIWTRPSSHRTYWNDIAQRNEDGV